MTTLDSLSLAWRNVRSNLLRTSITVAIIAFGIMALIGIITAIQAMNQSLKESFSFMGATSFNNAIANTNGAVGDSLIASVSANKLTGSRTLPNTVVPAGSVIQVVQSVWNSAAPSTTSTSFVTTGFSASITPTSSSSKILIAVSTMATNTTTNANMNLTVYRGATNLGGNVNSAMSAYQNTGASYSWVPMSFAYLDSPSTTSATTYTLYFNASAGTSYVMWGAATSTITLMEIAG